MNILRKLNILGTSFVVRCYWVQADIFKMVLYLQYLLTAQASILLQPGVPETSLWPQKFSRLHESKKAYDKGTSPIVGLPTMNLYNVACVIRKIWISNY